MKRKGTLLVGIVLALLMALSFVRAEDSAPQPGTPADNECNPGGVLYREANQDGCPTVWYWKAGWYLARVNRGLLSRDAVPDEFKSVLPPLPKSNQTGGSTIPLVPGIPPVNSCWPHTSNVLGYRYVGPPNTLNNFRLYMDPTCNTILPPNANYIALIFAESQSDAEAICATLGTPNLFASFLSWAPTAPAITYLCQVDGPTS